MSTYKKPTVFAKNRRFFIINDNRDILKQLNGLFELFNDKFLIILFALFNDDVVVEPFALD